METIVLGASAVHPKGIRSSDRNRKKNDGGEPGNVGRAKNSKGADAGPATSPPTGSIWLLVALLATPLTPVATGQGFTKHTRKSPMDYVEEAVEMSKNFTCLTKCEGRKSDQLLTPGKLVMKAFIDSQCYCDEDCDIFGECCADILHSRVLANESPTPDNFTLITAGESPPTGNVMHRDRKERKFMGVSVQQWGCHEVAKPTKGPPIMAYLVDSCPTNYWDATVVIKCSQRHRIPIDQYSYILDLPVISSRSGIPYLNSFCMACNEEQMDRENPPFYNMNLTFGCTDVPAKGDRNYQESYYVKGRREWIEEGGNCTLSINDPEKLFFGAGKDLDPKRPGLYTRRCFATEETSCEDEELSTLCSMYALYVQAATSRGTKFYKNPHCALCQGKDGSDLRCAVKMKFVPIISVKYRPPKISTIFSIKWDGGGNGCSAFQMWDAKEEMCVAYWCRKGQVLRGGRCEAIVKQTTERYPSNWTTDDGNSSGSHPNDSVEGDNQTAGTRLSSLDSSIHSFIQGYLMLTCMSISVFFLIIHILIYSFLPKLRNLPGRNLLALSWALLLAQSIVLLSGIELLHDEGPWFCYSSAVVTHFFYLAAVFWMNVMSVDVWRTFSSSSSRHNQTGSRDSSKRMHLKYSAYAWGVPLLLTGLSIAIDMVPADSGSTLSKVRPGYGLTVEGMCWLGNSVGAAIFFSVPTITLLLANAGLFARSVFKIHENQESRRYMRKKAMEEETLCNQRVCRATESETTVAETSGMVPKRPFRRPDTTTSCISVKDKSRLYLYVKLATIMGLSWICGFVAAQADIKELWYPFILLNGLQGAFIFFMFDVKWKIMGMVIERITGKKPEWVSSSASSGRWPIFRNTLSWGAKARRRKSSEYAINDLGEFPVPSKKEAKSSRTTSSSLPTSSDAQMSSIPEVPKTPIRPSPLGFKEAEGLVTSTPSNGISRSSRNSISSYTSNER
ncbi:uncharacterized protein LOC124165832 isoform X2 [Ischnura elegans]|uniref:uncharacterized protein LOC124165832 isoform X2 n=1 Tax=Ischnura elegans TaxID=197161 RepID=UPI001ED89A53|nr:uncharacterized protein LOC124165832 isoform X2 [Ischnura elegans]